MRRHVGRATFATHVSAGHHVGRRDVTKGRTFVMVRDTNQHNLDGGWVFVSRSDLGKLCRSRNGCDPDDSES